MIANAGERVNREGEKNMDERYYMVARIDGDYAFLRRTDVEDEELLQVARALLPEEIDEGTALKYAFLQYEII